MPAPSHGVARRSSATVDTGAGLVDPLDFDQPGVPRVRDRAGDRDAARAAGREGRGRCARRSGRSCRGCRASPRWPGCPPAILWFGLTDATIYFVVLAGSIPSIANGLVAGIDQIPPHPAEGGPGARRARAHQRAAHPAARRAARLSRGLQAGLGVLLAVADGGGDHRGRAAARVRPRRVPQAGQRPFRHARR